MQYHKSRYFFAWISYNYAESLASALIVIIAASRN